MEHLLNQLVSKLRKAHGDDLVSVILYGSAADPSQHDPAFSDINTLCVLREITPRQLRAFAPLILWWRQNDMPAPLFMAANEIAPSTDCYAIEFRDMLDRRRILFGVDVVEGLTIDDSFHRVQVEYELRSKLLRLRHRAAEAYADNQLLCRLLLDSVSTFCVLLRHALLLRGVSAPLARREMLEAAHTEFGIEPEPFLRLLDIRQKSNKAPKFQAESLLGGYLREIERVTEAVNAMQKPILTGARGDQ
jgi:hypothetical protein